MFTAEIYSKRREELRRRVGQGLILLPGNVESPLNYPNNAYHFRQDSTFLYYFGHNVPLLVATIDADTGTVSASNKGGSSGATTADPPNYAVHDLYLIPQCVAKYPAKTKVFSDPSKTLTLDDIKDGTFTGRLTGGYVGTKYCDSVEPTTASYHKKVYEDDGGSVTNIIVEYQERDGDWLKCAVVSFENGVQGSFDCSPYMADRYFAGEMQKKIFLLNMTKQKKQETLK